MSDALEVLQTALVTALETHPVLADELTGVFDGPPSRATTGWHRPWPTSNDRDAVTPRYSAAGRRLAEAKAVAVPVPRRGALDRIGALTPSNDKGEAVSL